MRKGKSVVAVRAAMRTSGSFRSYRTLETGQRRQRKVADPEYKVRSVVQRISSADPFHDSLFKVDTTSTLYFGINIHGSSLTIILLIGY
jgi:hypothetical protein